jgi:hypothetical protein
LSLESEKLKISTSMGRKRRRNYEKKQNLQAIQATNHLQSINKRKQGNNNEHEKLLMQCKETKHKIRG